MNSIAVIMSVYRGDKLFYLQKALESLYTQTKREIDIYVWQDGQTSKEISQYLSLQYDEKRIKYAGMGSQNQGLASSLNCLLDIVSQRDYTYIARMDADDISLPNRFNLQYDFMEVNKNIDVVGGYIEEFSSDMEYEKVVQYPLQHEEMYAFFEKRVPLAHVTAFFRKSFFKKAGLYPVSSPSNEDTLLWMNGFLKGCRFANIPEILVKVRVSESFFNRRGGIVKAWNDFKDRVLVINTLGYNISSYFYALALFLVNIAPSRIKRFLYKRLR